MLLQRVVAILQRAEISHALVGAVAVASRGAPRSTFDLDLFTTDKRVLSEELWGELSRDGYKVECRRGDFDDPLAGVVRIGTKPDQIDVVVGKWKWETAIVDRALPMEVGGVTLRVPSRSDLILLKLAAGGPLDYQDAYRLLKLGDREELIAEIEARIGDLPRDARALWKRLVAES